MKSTFLNSIKEYQDYFLFLIVVLAGVFTKVYNAISKGKKPRLSWFLAEGIMSFFVAFSVYAVCDQYLNLNKILWKNLLHKKESFAFLSENISQIFVF